MPEDSNNILGGEWFTPTSALSRFSPSGQLHGNTTETAGETIRYGFRVGNIGLLLAAAVTSEVVDDAIVNPLPATEPWLCGILNLRGNLTPVFDLKILFGGEAPSDSEAPHRTLATQPLRLLILDKGEKSIGIRINSLPRAIETDHPLGQMPPLPSSLENHVANSYEFEGEVWLDFDHRSFFKVIGGRIAK